MVRRYCAKLLYEIELHAADDVTQLEGRYVEAARRRPLKIEPSSTDYLADVDSGFYVTESTSRSWAFEAQLRDHHPRAVRQRLVRPARGRVAAAGAVVALGQRYTADELLADVTGAELQMDAVGDRVREDARPLSRDSSVLSRQVRFGHGRGLDPWTWPVGHVPGPNRLAIAGECRPREEQPGD